MILSTIAYKNSDEETKKTDIEKNYDRQTEVINFKKFLLTQIRSPFMNINYEIKNGDTIQKILKKYNVKNREVQLVILEFKKFAKSNQLSVGKKIDIIIKKENEKNNSVIKFSVPITKSTTVEIIKNEENKLVSKKIITKLYKRKTLSENVIKNNLYTSAIKGKWILS